jgi:hypothetical protein
MRRAPRGLSDPCASHYRTRCGESLIGCQDAPGIDEAPDRGDERRLGEGLGDGSPAGLRPRSAASTSIRPGGQFDVRLRKAPSEGQRGRIRAKQRPLCKTSRQPAALRTTTASTDPTRISGSGICLLRSDCGRRSSGAPAVPGDGPPGPDLTKQPTSLRAVSDGMRTSHAHAPVAIVNDHVVILGSAHYLIRCIIHVLTIPPLCSASYSGPA